MIKKIFQVILILMLTTNQSYSAGSSSDSGSKVKKPKANTPYYSATIRIKKAKKLEAKGIGTRVVSMPCWELFKKQDLIYRKRVLPSGPVRVAIEAGIEQGWEKWLYGERGNENKASFVGMKSFGASGPANELYNTFEITAEEVIERVDKLLSKR